MHTNCSSESGNSQQSRKVIVFFVALLALFSVVGAHAVGFDLAAHPGILFMGALVVGLVFTMVRFSGSKK